ncbi:MAG: hypothetical protein KDC87_18975 [Planctomycetes bacterium]|nr:hypothetical protein [Planctomycetota bacterium]MCB9872107.1 hypothetical protein [Planctomycetota bacterium]
MTIDPPVVSAAERRRVIVSGYIVRRPLGGGVFCTLQYALGLLRLGHDVWFFEDSEDYPACYDPTRHVTDTDPAYGLRFAGEVLDHYGLGARWCYYDAHTDRWLGPCAAHARSICATADVVITASGRLRPWTAEVPRRVFVDKDPLFAQAMYLRDASRRAAVAQHNAFFTYGHNIPAGTTEVPDDGFAWRALRQPVVLDIWKVAPPPEPGQGRYTTLMQWNAYPPAEIGGQHYGLKSHAFGPFEDLPQRVDVGLELAVGGSEVPRERLRRFGWHITDPLLPSRSPAEFQRYLAASRGEFTVAKHGYVAARTGWFSERAAHYLASGRPVITQDTGFTEWLPAGDGLLAFSTSDQAVAALQEVERRHAHHCRAARELVAEYFDARKVLPALLD